jgi:hypothetical protein
MEDTLKLSFFSLHRLDIFHTPFGEASNSFSTVTHARVMPTHQISINHFHAITFHKTLAAFTIK